MSQETIEDREKEGHKVLSMVRWLLIVACILLAGNLIRGEQINDNVDRGKTASHDAERAATRAATASKKASDDLAKAIEATSSPEAAQQSLKAFTDLAVSRLILCNEFPASCAKAEEQIPAPQAPTTTSPGG